MNSAGAGTVYYKRAGEGFEHAHSSQSRQETRKMPVYCDRCGGHYSPYFPCTSNQFTKENMLKCQWCYCWVADVGARLLKHARRCPKRTGEASPVSAIPQPAVGAASFTTCPTFRRKLHKKKKRRKKYIKKQKNNNKKCLFQDTKIFTSISCQKKSLKIYYIKQTNR
jgi:hypothetical protein